MALRFQNQRRIGLGLSPNKFTILLKNYIHIRLILRLMVSTQLPATTANSIAPKSIVFNPSAAINNCKPSRN
jgi:hypothetical protein